MPRVLIFLIAVATALLAQPATGEARSLRYALHHAILAPFGVVAGIINVHHRSAWHHRHGHHPDRFATAPPGGHPPVQEEGTASTAAEEPAAAPAPSHTAAVTPSGESAGARTSAGASGGPWASGYDDLFGYVFTPASGEAFWQHGAADLRAAVFPAAGLQASARTTACPTQRPDGIAGWPAARVEQTLKPTDAQRQGLDKLHAALDQAFDRTRASCAAAAPRAATDRLGALNKRLEALRDAVLVVRAPLGELYASLSDEQKARLNSASRQAVADASASSGGAEAQRLVRDCTADGGANVQATAGQLMQLVQPTADQRQTLEIFAGTFGHVTGMLKTSCPADMPLTPMGRLNAAEKRLRVMLYAIVILRGPLDRFHAALTDEQKARFDTGLPGAQPEPRRGAELRPRG